MLGVGAPALAGALWAVENGAEAARRRREQAAAQRARLAAEFPVASRPRPVRVAGRGRSPRSWRRAGSTSRPAPPGATSSHVRVTLHDAAATDRLLAALRETNASARIR